jgi:hypothetical protein
VGGFGSFHSQCRIIRGQDHLTCAHAKHNAHAAAHHSP